MAETTTAAPASAADTPSQETVDKIHADLEVLTEKLDLCTSMLTPKDGEPQPSITNHDSLPAVIGFLEACAPRMIELVQAAAQEALSEHVLMKCLEVNDRLIKQLEDIETIALTETAASTTAAAAPPPTQQMDDLLLTDNSDDNFKEEDAKKPAAIGKSTGEEEEDFFADNVLTVDAAAPPRAATDPFAPAAPAPAALAAAPKDDFDSFFEERTASKGSDASS